MSDLTYLPAWRLGDPKVEADAKELWEQLKMLPKPDKMESRLKELVATAYLDDRIVALESASVTYVKELKARIAVYRLCVAPEARRQLVSRYLGVYCRDLLEKWSLDNPEEKVLGVGAIIQAQEYAERQRQPVWSEMGLNLNLAFYLANRDEQFRVSWFKHARLEE